MVNIAAAVAFQFVLVATHQSADVVFMNEDISAREFNLGEMKCTSSLESKADPVVEGQTLGIMTLSCKHGDYPIKTSVTCSLLDPAAQNHFEFGEGDQKYSFDLVCKAKAQANVEVEAK